MKNRRRYDISQCALYKCNTRRKLATLLNLDYISLMSIQKIITYHAFETEKKGTDEKRAITAPDKQLKIIQRRVLYLLRYMKRPHWLISSEKGKSYIDNGKAHLNGRYALTIDIRKFYDNCGREAVYSFFSNKLRTSPDVSKLLTDIVTYNGRIPTGCPTSQIIAYYAYEDMFEEIAKIASAFGCTFTLFVDDMTFSSEGAFDKDKLGSLIDCALRKYGHKPKYKKVRYYPKSASKPVTGTIITPDNRLEIPNNLQEKIYNGFQDLKRYMGDATNLSGHEKKIDVLKGRIQAARNIDSDRFPEIRRIVQHFSTDCSQ